MAINISRIDDKYSTCAQLSDDDLNEVAEAGYKTVVNFRPDDEGGVAQVLSATLATEADRLGLHYAHIPVIPSQVSVENIEAFIALLAQAPEPILGFCRTGNRANKLYQIVQQD